MSQTPLDELKQALASERLLPSGELADLDDDFYFRVTVAIGCIPEDHVKTRFVNLYSTLYRTRRGKIRSMADSGSEGPKDFISHMTREERELVESYAAASRAFNKRVTSYQPEVRDFEA